MVAVKSILYDMDMDVYICVLHWNFVYVPH